jgi:hypothetical protein
MSLSNDNVFKLRNEKSILKRNIDLGVLILRQLADKSFLLKKQKRISL